MKQAQIASKQYCWGQLDKHIVTDPLDDIPEQIENQTHIKSHTKNDQLNVIYTGNRMNSTQQENTSNNNRIKVNQTNGRINSEQKDSVNNIPLHKNIEEQNEKVTLIAEPDCLQGNLQSI